jgi:hypothetical protein
MFWTKVKTVVGLSLAVAVAAVLTPLAVGAFSGEAAAPADPSGAAAPAAAAEPVPVDGLKLTLRLVPDKISCSDACAAKPLGQWVKCAGCDGRTGSGRFCWSCGVDRGLCEVCGGKVPAERLTLKELKAGATARLALTFENVSKDELRICDYLLGMQKAKLEVAGPDAASVKRAPTGVRFCLAAIDAVNFPELPPGAKRSYWLRLAGNPPGIDQGAVRTLLLKPGLYRLTASYSNETDSYFDNRTRQQVKPDGKVWKNKLNSGALEIKVTGEVQPPPAGRPGIIRAM